MTRANAVRIALLIASASVADAAPAPTVDLNPCSSTSQVFGNLDVMTVCRFVRRARPQIAQCCERGPERGGNVSIQFVIAATGTVEQWSSDGFDAATAECIGKVIAGIEFPRSASSSQITYPLSCRAAPRKSR